MATRFFLFWGAVAWSLVSGGCSEESARRGVEWGAPRALTACENGAERRCSVTLEQEAGVLSCYHGVQSCRANVWGTCENGAIRQQVAPTSRESEGGTRETLALSAAIDCVDNPCDPTCQVFIEDPPDITAMGGAGGAPSIFIDAPPPDWSTGAGMAPCAHGLCSEGSALDSTCHPCVAQVCSADPECCTDTGGMNWDSACVGLAYSECLGQAPKPPLPANHLCQYAAFGADRARFINSGSVSGGAVGTNATGAPWHIDIGGSTMSIDRVVSAGDVQVSAGASVAGGVTTSGSINNSGTVGGRGEEAGVPFAPLSLPTRAVDCVAAETSFTNSAGLTVPDGDTRVFQPSGPATFTFEAPGRFGGFAANGGTARLVFKEPGTYTFSKWTLNFGSEITIELPPGGNVIVETCGMSDAQFYPGGGQFELHGALRLIQSDGTPALPHQLQIYTNFHDSIPVSATSLQGLSLIAPRARVYSAGNTGAAHGMIWAREVELVTDIDFSASGFTGSACLEAGLLEPHLSACPISLAVPAMPPTRKNGCLSGEDCQVNSRCVDVKTASSCEHSKCLEGEALDSSCRSADPCVARICEEEPSCCQQVDGLTCLSGNRCVAAACGDGMVRGLEECDDDNGSAGDGCSDTCQIEPGFVCSGEPSVCQATVCGDGVIEGDEDCDDGGLNPWDGCSPTCEVEPACPPQGGACSSQCGDGMTLSGDAEDCDDGNNLDGDGCSSICTIELGFTCAPQALSTEPFIDMPVVYRDFANQGASRHPDFEYFEGLPLTRGLVAPVLGADGLPAYTGLCEEGTAINATDCPNFAYESGYSPTFSGYQTTSQANFDEWYRPSANSFSYADTIRLGLSGGNYRFAPGSSFYPLSARPQPLTGDGLTLASTGNWENFAFTSEVRSWFVYRGGEQLYFEGDDDVWVFINGQLALDLGGLHQKTAGQVTLAGSFALEEWWDPTAAYPGSPNPAPAWPGNYQSNSRNLGLTVGSAYEIALFHAERRSIESNFTLTLSGFFEEPSLCAPICGDGLVVRGEVCDDGADNGSPGMCSLGCQSWEDAAAPPEWGPECVEMVKSVCDAFCGDTSTFDCGHGACEVGEALDISCSTCAADVCTLPSLAYCCDDAAGSWDAACIRMANQVCTEAGDRACDYAVLSNGTVHVETFDIQNGLTSGGHVEVTNGPDGPGMTDDVFAWGSVDVQAGVTGNIVAGGSITQSGGATGSQSPHEDVKKFQITERAFSCGPAGTTTIASGSPQSIAPGTYSGFVVDNGAALTFSAPGDYFIHSLAVYGTGKLVLPDAGNVNIHVCEDVVFAGWGYPTTVGPSMELTTGGTPAQQDAARFRFFINGSGGSVIANWADVWGMFFLPHSGIYVGSRGRVRGLVHAEGDISTNWHGYVNGDQIVGATCLASQIVAGPDRGASECDYALVGAGSMTIVGGEVRGGDVSGGGAVQVSPLTSGCEPPASGLCTYTPSIQGNVSTAGAFAGCSHVTGSCATNLGAAHELPVVATRSFSCPTGGANAVLSTGDAFPPGTYGNVVVLAGETVSFSPGTYAVQSLTVQDGAQITLPSSGTVELDACGRAQIGSGVTTSGATSSADALRFQIYSASSDHTPLPGPKADNAIYVGSQTTLYATLSAPTGAVLLDEWAHVFGFVHASEGIILSGATLDATGVTGDSCVYNPQFGTCDAVDIETTTTTIDETAICVENGQDFVDSACSGIDLAVDFGCGPFVPVCNQGTVEAPAGLELTFFPRAGHQFANTSPDPTWALGRCLTTEPIPSGTCISQACDPTLMSQDATVAVNIDQTIPECSYLDNWSLKDVSEACPAGTTAANITFSEIYEASCPSDSRPAWGLLTYSSQAPGQSEITIRGRLAGSSSALSSEPYSSLGSARSIPTDTQVCSYLSTEPACPIDVAAFLPISSDDFSVVQNATTGQAETISFLELEFSLRPFGFDAPTLEDWSLTYSCVYDQ